MSEDTKLLQLSAAHLRDNLPEIEDAHPHAGLIQALDKRQLISFLATVHGPEIVEEDIYRDIVRSEATESLTDAVKAGNVSQMQFAQGMVDNGKDGGDAFGRVSKALAAEGTVALVLGPAGSGKTAFTLDAARTWKARTGGMIVSNIASWEGTDVVVKDDEELMQAMASIRGQVLAVLDETGQSLSGEGEEVKAAQKMAKGLKYGRKRLDGDEHARQGSALLVGHTRRETAADIRRLASLVVEKPSQQDKGRAVLYESDGGKDSLDKLATYKGLTDTAESYNEHEASEFRVILDDEDGDDGPDVEDVQRDSAIKTALRAKLRGDSHPDAAGLVDYKSSWVGDRWREWLRGDHRDVVAMPDDPPEHVVDALDEIA